MPPHILVTNDDGIESPGLWALARAARAHSERVSVVAPFENQSAVGAGFTLRRELVWKPIPAPPVDTVEAWHVSGTPADCVMLALDDILKDEPPVTMVLSGVNRGSNIGWEVLASGTVGGAMHGHFRDIPAMAVSQYVEGDGEIDWSVAERVTSTILDAIIANPIMESVLLNVNVPYIPYEQIRGVVVTRMGRHGYIKLAEVAKNTAILERESIQIHPDAPPGTDIWGLVHNYVSVSPIQANLTLHHVVDRLSGMLNAAFSDKAVGAEGPPDSS